MYIAGRGCFFLWSGIEALVIGLQLAIRNRCVISAEHFNEMMTMHGTAMIFLAAMHILIGFMNLIMPLQIGARDVAFPFLNALGFWLFFLGGLLLNTSWFLGGAPDAG